MRRIAILTAAGAVAALFALEAATGPSTAQEKPAAPAGAADGLAVATFAGGCFWCMEPPFDKLDGVVSTTSGYIGGTVENPSYKQVTAGNTGHTEAVQVRYDPAKVSYGMLLDVYWRNVDPLDAGGQFCDRGDQYRPAIFAHGEEQARLAERSRDEVTAMLKAPVAVTVEPATTFWPAEGYHQNYYQTNPLRYSFYRYSCGRDQRLEQVWGGKPAG